MTRNRLYREYAELLDKGFAHIWNSITVEIVCLILERKDKDGNN